MYSNNSNNYCKRRRMSTWRRCPVKAMTEWLFVRGVLETQETNFEFYFNSPVKIIIKPDALEWPCWVTISHGQLTQDSPLLSRNMAKRGFFCFLFFIIN